MRISDYIIRGGIQGRERLRILSRVMRPTTVALLERAGLRPGMTCLEAGCGGGDVAFDMARKVGPSGRVVGIDIDQKVLDLATAEAAGQEISNIEFRRMDITEGAPIAGFDFVHARFLLSHLADPAGAVARMRGALRPGGVIALVDVDFRGHFCYPESKAYARFVELYTETARRKGGDANIGPRLPSLLAGAGFKNVQMNVFQPAGMTGEVKLLTPLTMENIAGAVAAAGLALEEEVKQLVAELYEHAQTAGTIGSAPRIVEAWGENSPRG